MSHFQYPRPIHTDPRSAALAPLMVFTAARYPDDDHSPPSLNFYGTLQPTSIPGVFHLDIQLPAQGGRRTSLATVGQSVAGWRGKSPAPSSQFPALLASLAAMVDQARSRFPHLFPIEPRRAPSRRLDRW